MLVALPDVIVCESIQDRTRSSHQRMSMSMISVSRKVNHMSHEFDRIQFRGLRGR
jgi:hypothetical protein